MFDTKEECQEAGNNDTPFRGSFQCNEGCLFDDDSETDVCDIVCNSGTGGDLECSNIATQEDVTLGDWSLFVYSRSGTEQLAVTDYGSMEECQGDGILEKPAGGSFECSEGCEYDSDVDTVVCETICESDDDDELVCRD